MAIANSLNECYDRIWNNDQTGREDQIDSAGKENDPERSGHWMWFWKSEYVENWVGAVQSNIAYHSQGFYGAKCSHSCFVRRLIYAGTYRCFSYKLNATKQKTWKYITPPVLYFWRSKYQLIQMPAKILFALESKKPSVYLMAFYVVVRFCKNAGSI